MITLVNVSQEKELGYLEFVKPVENLIKRSENCQIMHFLDKKFKEKCKKSGKLLICGTQLNDNNFLGKIRRFDFLKDYSGEVLGICAGAEIIARIFGGTIKSGCEIGMREVKVVKNCELLRGKDRFGAYCLHCLAMDLRENFEVLAQSGEFIEAFKVKNKGIYGVVFHPEVRNHWILENFLSSPYPDR